MHGSASVVQTGRTRFQQLAKDSSPKLIGGIALVWLILVVLLHSIGVAGAWVMTMLTCSLTACIDIFALVTFQEYSDGVIREPAEVARTCNPLYTLAIVFRAFSLVQSLHVNSWFLAVVFLLSLAYELGLLRRFPSSVDVTTLWKDVEPMKKELRWKVGFGVGMFFVTMFVMLVQLLGGSLKRPR